MNAIASLRVHAIWGRRKDVRHLLITGFVSTYTISTVLLVVGLGTLIPTAGYIPAIQVCFAASNQEIWAIWIPGIAYEVILFVLTTTKTIHHIKRRKELPLMHVLMRDSFIEFAILFLGRFFNVFIWALAPQSLLLLGQHCVWAVVTVATSRLLLNLRGMGRMRDLDDAVMSQNTDPLDMAPLNLSTNALSTYSEEDWQEGSMPYFDIS